MDKHERLEFNTAILKFWMELSEKVSKYTVEGHIFMPKMPSLNFQPPEPVYSSTPSHETYPVHYYGDTVEGVCNGLFKTVLQGMGYKATLYAKIEASVVSAVLAEYATLGIKKWRTVLANAVQTFDKAMVDYGKATR